MDDGRFSCDEALMEGSLFCHKFRTVLENIKHNE
jgi:hypothetical protein